VQSSPANASNMQRLGLCAIGSIPLFRRCKQAVVEIFATQKRSGYPGNGLPAIDASELLDQGPGAGQLATAIISIAFFQPLLAARNR
jgi:hypothetical protein